MQYLLFILLFLFGCSEDSNPVGFEVPEGYVFLWGEFYNIQATIELDKYEKKTCYRCL